MPPERPALPSFMLRSLLVVLLLARAGTWMGATEAAPEVVPVELFSVPEGFEVTLWARSPLVRNPTNMDIDAKGRIWITEGVNYRKNSNRQPDGDCVVMLED